MKVLVFTTLYPNPEEPNKGTFIRDRVRHVAAEPGVEVEVVAPVPYFPRIPLGGRLERWAKFARVPREESRDGLGIHHPSYLVTPKFGMTRYGASLARGTRSLVRAIRRRFAFDVIDAHYLYPDAYAAVTLGRELGVPVVVSARGTDTHTYSDIRAVRPLLVRALEGASAVVSVSEDLKQRIGELAPGVGDVTVIPNGVDTERFAPMDRALARKKVGLATAEASGPLIVIVGRLTPVKAHDVLLEAFARLVRDREDSPRLAIVGGGELREPLTRQARELGLADRVTFAGERSQSELADWYNAADVSCLPSHREGWPNALMEAIACGTPVVASRVGGAPEIVCEDALGRLVAPGDPDALAAGLGQALDREWDRDRLRAYASERSWGQTARRCIEVLRSTHANPLPSPDAR